MITITKTKEQAQADAKRRQKIAQENLKDSVCPYCKKDDNVEITHDFASASNPFINLMVDMKLMKDKTRRNYHCYKCGAEWHGEWYER